jgi:serine/threonine-protein kinase RsbW
MKEGFKTVESISVPSNFDHLPTVESLIDRICNQCGVSEDAYGNVLISVTEAFNNALIHGNKMVNELEVAVAVAEDHSELCFAVKDQGAGFDFVNIDDPTSPENIEKENGRGIYLMRHLADEVVFTNGGREVNIYFKK